MPSPPQLTSPWSDDFLERSKEAELLKSFLLRRVDERALLGRSRSFVLNIDAQWGKGKTFFLERFGQQLTQEGFIVAHVNAWEDDHADDPLVPVLAAIEKAVEPFLGRSPATNNLLQAVRRNGVEIAVSLARNFLVTLARKHLGDALDELPVLLSDETIVGLEESLKEGTSEAVKELGDKASKAIINRYLQDKDASQSFKSKLAELIRQLAQKEKKHSQLIVLVDELDRCRPTYAIQMLERVKHLFDTDGMIFIIATDTSQLRHSIRAVYGAGFDSQNYLQRFFDRQYRFRDVSMLSLVKQLRSSQVKIDNVSVPPLQTQNEEAFDVFVTRTFHGFGLELRDLHKAFELFSDFVTTWRHKSKIEIMYLLPLICAKLKIGMDLRELNDEHMNAIRVGLRWPLIEAYSREERRRTIDAYSYFTALHNHRLINLSETSMAFRGDSSEAAQWARERFDDEFRLNHGSIVRLNQHLSSVLIQYASDLESVGNLTSG